MASDDERAPAPSSQGGPDSTADPERSILEGIPTDLPTLLLARALTERAALVGFDWPDVAPVWDKIDEEVAELKQALAHAEGPERVEAELGDLLMAITNLSRFLSVDPERALRRATQRFIQRFQGMERAAAEQGRRLEQYSLDEQEELWQAEKRRLKGDPAE